MSSKEFNSYFIISLYPFINTKNRYTIPYEQILKFRTSKINNKKRQNEQKQIKLMNYEMQKRIMEK